MISPSPAVLFFVFVDLNLRLLWPLLVGTMFICKLSAVWFPLIFPPLWCHFFFFSSWNFMVCWWHIFLFYNAVMVSFTQKTIFTAFRWDLAIERLMSVMSLHELSCTSWLDFFHFIRENKIKILFLYLMLI